MPRDIPVGNGSFLIAFGLDYLIRDIYYPCVGKENHTDGHEFRFGVWSDGQMSWIGPGDWDLDLDYREDMLSTAVTATNVGLGLVLSCNDTVDFAEDIYIRRVVVRNTRQSDREVRLFFHHDFHIMGSALGDTAYYDPDEKGLIHYKDNRYFLASGMQDGRHELSQFSTGIKEFRNLEGTWKDAEDGILAGNTIAQGSVDSVLSLTFPLPAGGEKCAYYWIAAGRDYAAVSRLNRMVLGHGPEHFISRTDNYWNAWINKEKLNLEPLPERLARLYRKSLLIMTTNIDRGGAILAANDSDIQHFSRDTYSYLWPRDGALTAYALDKAGYADVTRRFFEFCFALIGEGKESVGYFLHKYNPNGSVASSWHPWLYDSEKRLPIQEDGTALVLWALWSHFERYRDIELIAPQYERAIIRWGDFLASYRDQATGLPLPCYDLWEEAWGVHTFTVATVHAGLRSARNFATLFGDRRRETIYTRAAMEVMKALIGHLWDDERGRFLKTIVPKGNGRFTVDYRIDSSVYAPFYFGVLEPDDERIVKTMGAIEANLTVSTPVSGISRYEGDSYQRKERASGFPGNPWIICSLWIAQWKIATSRSKEDLQLALSRLEWAASHALRSGVLAEQIDPFDGSPVSVSPLTWSHAAFVTSILEYLEKLEGIDTCPACGMPLYTLRGNEGSRTGHLG